MSYRFRFFLFFIGMVLFGLASNFAHPVTPTIIQDLNLHDYMFGLALASMMVVNFLMSPFWGKINTRISSRLTLLICNCGYGVGQIWFAYAKTELMIIFARMFAGFFIGGIMVSFLTYVVNVAKPEDQPKYLTYSATIQSVCGAFGYLIGGVVGEFSVKAAFIMQAALLIITGVVFYIACESDKKELEQITAKQLLKESNPLQAFLDCRKFMTVSFAFLFAVAVLVNFGNTGFDQAFNYYLKDQLSLTSSYNGIIKAAVGFVSFVSNMSLCIWIIRKTNVARSMVIMVTICTLAGVGALVAPGIGLFIGFSILLYAGYSVSMPILQNMVAVKADPNQKNLVMGFFNAMKSLGGIAGSLTAGFIYSVNAKLPFACTAIIYGIGIFAAIGYLVRGRKEMAEK